MMLSIRVLWTLSLVAASLTLQTPALEGQADQEALARDLMSDDRGAQIRAVYRIRALDAREIETELIDALVQVAERENATRRARMEALRRGARGPEYEERDTFAGDVFEVLVQLKARETIPVLVEGMDTGSMVPRALADFGELAAPVVLDTVGAEDPYYRHVWSGLLTLRFMMEDPGAHPLSEETLDRIRGVAKRYLDEPGDQVPDLVLRLAIDLALILDDSHLREIVELLALDMEAVKVRAPALQDEQRLDRVRRHAAERLAGEPALPPRH